MNFAAILDQHARDRPNASAVLGERIGTTYDDLKRLSSRAAAWLEGQGVGRGDRVALLLGNRPEFVISLLGCFRLGAVAVPLNVRLTSGEIADLIEDSGSSLLLAEEGRSLELGACSVWTAEELNQQLLNEDLDEEFRPVMCQSNELASIMYTAGTSGRPKGVMQSHGMHVALGAGLVDCFELTERDTTMLLSPLFHIGGFTELVAAIYLGGPFKLEPKWDMSKVLSNIERFDVTYMHMITTVVLDIVNAEIKMPSEYSLDTLQHVFSGGGSVTSEQLRWFEQRFNCMISEGYGRTEGSKAWTPPTMGRKTNLNGVPNITVAAMRIVDPTRECEMPAGEEGEIRVKGDGVGLGYWRRPELNAELFDADGWMRTGDRGAIGADGYLRFAGRVDGMIKSGGENVYPREVEQVLLAIQGVRYALVIGVPDERLGETVAAVIVADDDVDESLIESETRQRLAGFKIPRRVRFVEEIPRLGSGKQDVGAIRDLFAREREAQ